VLARLLLRSLLIELLVYLAGGFLLWRYAGLAPGAAVSLAILSLLGLRALGVVLLFAIAWRYRAERPCDRRLGWARAAGLFCAEWASMLALYGFFHPLEPWLRLPNNTTPTQSSNPPVLLIHGYVCNAAFWWSIARYLRHQGLDNVHTINLEPVFADIDDYAAQVADRVEQLCTATGAEQVVLIGHSMGGLVARAYLHGYGERRRVAGIITLGTPHHGTAHARFSLTKARNVQQLLPGNPWLTALNADEAQPAAAPVISIYSDHDDLVTPQSSPALFFPNARNIAVVGVGHLAMAFDRSFRSLLYAQLVQLRGKTHNTST
jgi:pimeloyl-ACP methyl ester carboxylesterase